ncbi:MAG: galactose-1-phosphate uridylyltransferase [Elusimicrobia bacterium]|nr:galactose-1-phosphate uridylyltransferase [Elusimicrobiota bacterium]
MPEFRQNLATKDWVVIASERAARPEDFRRPPRAPSPKDGCPFCPGGEAHKAAASFELPAGKSWKVRVIPNKFPVLVPTSPAPKARHPLYRSLPGEGLHEIIVDTPDHEADLADMPEAHARELAGVWRERFRSASASDRVAMTVLFKNYGPGSGASIHHPVTHVVGSSVVPSHIRHRMDEAARYYDSAGSCVFCRMSEAEQEDKSRVVEENDHFVAFVLYAALSPFHIWVLPKRHMASFSDMNEKELSSIAAILQRLARRLRAALGDPSFNFVVQSAPLDRGTTEAYHWYLSLVVRVGGGSGFEMGSGIFTNTVVPEEAARFLQSAKV